MAIAVTAALIVMAVGVRLMVQFVAEYYVVQGQVAVAAAEYHNSRLPIGYGANSPDFLTLALTRGSTANEVASIVSKLGFTTTGPALDAQGKQSLVLMAIKKYGPRPDGNCGLTEVYTFTFKLDGKLEQAEYLLAQLGGKWQNQVLTFPDK